MSQYLVSTDPRITNIQKRFEEVLNACPPELNPWQNVKITRKTGWVLVEVISSFRLDLESSCGSEKK